MSDMNPQDATDAANLLTSPVGDSVCEAILAMMKPLIPDQVSEQERPRFLAHILARAAGMAASEANREESIGAIAHFAMAGDTVTSIARAMSEENQACVPMASMVGAMNAGWMIHSAEMIQAKKGES